MLKMKGTVASPGFCIGRAYIFRHDIVCAVKKNYKSLKERQAQQQDFKRAVGVVGNELDRLIALAATKEENDILFTHKLMVEDPEFLLAVDDEIIKHGKSASWAVEAVLETQISILEKMDSSLFRERIGDIKSVCESILSELLKNKSHTIPGLEFPMIMVADYLSPSEFIAMDKTNLLSLVLLSGGKTSHVVLLANSLNIPTLIISSDIFSNLHFDDLLILDAFNGILTISPDKEEKRKAEDFLKERMLVKKESDTDYLIPVTLDGKRVSLELNITGNENLDDAFFKNAEGVGLLRTEFLIMNTGFIDSEEEFQHYKRIVQKVGKYGPLTIRSYDIGGDKGIKDISFKEDNPILGYRAIRLCLGNRALFQQHLSSILRASAFGKIRLMFPMISGIEELDECLNLLEEVKERLRENKIRFDEDIEVGIMIEVPSAAIISDVLAKKVDFFSVGTNDLIQYTIAVDRGNEKISYLYNPLHPAVLQLLKLIVDNAHKNKIKVGMCGEMAGMEFYTPLLVGMGFDELSMNSQNLIGVGHVIRSINYSEAEALVSDVIKMDSASKIENYLKDWIDGKN